MKKQLLLILVLFISVGLNAQTTIFSENFDSLTADQYVTDQQPLLWPWTGAVAEKSYVRNTQSHSPNNSMEVVNDNDMLYDFGGKTSGIYYVSFWMYVDTGAYFNIEHAFGSSWAFSFYFKPGGTCDLIEGGTTHTFNYALNTWMQIELDFNLEVDSATATVDGTEIASWLFSNEENAPGGVNQLDVIDFYGLHDVSTGVPLSVYYVDDFEFVEIQSGLLPPTIDIDTTPIVNYNLANEIIPFSNTGETVMNFSAYPTFIDPSITSNLSNGVMTYDGGSMTAIGWTTQFEVYAATRFLPDKACAHLGQNIVSANIFIYDAPVGDTIRVYVWEKGEYAVPGATTILAEKAYTAIASMDNTVVFDTPVPINGDEIWIGYRFTTPASGYTLGMDTLATVPHTSYIKSGPVWSEFTGIGGDMKGNFCIRANVEGLGWPVWLNVAPSSGTVAASGNQDLTLSFDTTELVPGTYEADVIVGCNDPANEWTEIHVTLDFYLGINNYPSFGVLTYPNPSSDFFNIVSDVPIDKIIVYTIEGRTIKNLNPRTAKVSVNIEDLTAGTYIFEITAGNQIMKKKVIIK